MGAPSLASPDAEIIVSTFVLNFIVWRQNIWLAFFCNGRDSERGNHSDLIAPRPIPSPRRTNPSRIYKSAQVTVVSEQAVKIPINLKMVR